MKVIEVAIGNNKESYILSNFSKEKINIIYSVGNNRGKTIVLQTILYALGNTGMFPEDFKTPDYYFYTEITYNDRSYKFLRKKNGISVLCNNNIEELTFFPDIRSFQNYFSKTFFELPHVLHKDEDKMISIDTFYQIFFLQQDKRNTSNIQKTNMFNKKHFIEMISNIKYEYFETQKDVLNKINDMKSIITKNTELKNFLEKSNINNIEKIPIDTIEKIENEYNRYLKKSNEFKSKKMKLIRKRSLKEGLLSDIDSLNRSLDVGKVSCMDCGSEKIVFKYSKDSMAFDITNTEMRKQIRKSITDEISNIASEIEDLESSILEEEKDHLEYLENNNISPDWANLIFLNMKSIEGYDIRKSIIDLDIKNIELGKNIKKSLLEIKERKEQIKKTENEIVLLMNNKYNLFHQTSDYIEKYKGMFSKSTETISGSDSQEYHCFLLLSLQEYLNHRFPIIIDSFREQEISTLTEEKMISLYSKLDNQIILSCTLKEEEYSAKKYDDLRINRIDFSTFEERKLLNESQVPKFLKILEQFGVCVV